MKRIIVSILLTSSLVVAHDGLYTQSFIASSELIKSTVSTNDKSQATVERFSHQKGFHYSSLSYDEGLTAESKKILDLLIDRINKSRSQSYTVTLIGYTSSTRNPNERIQLNSWSSFWHSLGSSDGLTQNESKSRVNSNLRDTVNYLTHHGIHPTKIYTENRLGKDKLYTEATSDGVRLNNRVDVAVYGMK